MFLENQRFPGISLFLQRVFLVFDSLQSIAIPTFQADGWSRICVDWARSFTLVCTALEEISTQAESLSFGSFHSRSWQMVTDTPTRSTHSNVSTLPSQWNLPVDIASRFTGNRHRCQAKMYFTVSWFAWPVALACRPKAGLVAQLFMKIASAECRTVKKENTKNAWIFTTSAAFKHVTCCMCLSPSPQHLSFSFGELWLSCDRKHHQAPSVNTAWVARYFRSNFMNFHAFPLNKTCILLLSQAWIQAWTKNAWEITWPGKRCEDVQDVKMVKSGSHEWMVSYDGLWCLMHVHIPIKRIVMREWPSSFLNWNDHSTCCPPSTRQHRMPSFPCSRPFHVEAGWLMGSLLKVRILNSRWIRKWTIYRLCMCMGKNMLNNIAQGQANTCSLGLYGCMRISHMVAQLRFVLVYYMQCILYVIFAIHGK